MKKSATLIALVLSTLSTNYLLGQTSVATTCGYTVSASFNTVAIVPAVAICPFGYNYEVRFKYIITVTGVNTCFNGNIQIRPEIMCGTNTSQYSQITIPAPTVGSASSSVTYSGIVNTNNGQYTSTTGCNTATPSSLVCTGCNFGINGPGITTGIKGCSFIAGLPIELISFVGNCNNGSVSLNWETATETNNNFFTIEKSNDALTWQSIAEIKGAGNSTNYKTYSYNDNEKNTEKITYYKLKQTDYDGKYAYSPIIDIAPCANINNNTTGPFPNPTNGEFVIETTQLMTDSCTYTVYNALGNLEMKGYLYKGTNKLQLKSNAPSGLYLLIIQQNQNTALKYKIIKE